MEFRKSHKSPKHVKMNWSQFMDSVCYRFFFLTRLNRDLSVLYRLNNVFLQKTIFSNFIPLFLQVAWRRHICQYVVFAHLS